MFIKLLEMCKRLLHLSISHNTPSCSLRMTPTRILRDYRVAFRAPDCQEQIQPLNAYGTKRN